MNEDFKNSTCSESTSTRYEKEISLHHHLVKETEYMKDHIEIGSNSLTVHSFLV